MSPVFVYTPANAQNAGILPQNMMKMSMEREGLSSSDLKSDTLLKQTSSDQITGSVDEGQSMNQPHRAIEEITESMKATNKILQILRELCMLDDSITCKNIIHYDNLFVFLQIAGVQIAQ